MKGMFVTGNALKMGKMHEIQKKKVFLEKGMHTHCRIKRTKREGGNGRQKRQTVGVGNEKKKKKNKTQGWR